MAHFFIHRPVFAIVASLFIVITGLLSLFRLPIAQYPQIVLPTINVSAAYLGADSEVVEESVAAPIEQQVNGVEGMLYMSSLSCNDGTYSLNVTFDLECNPDIAAVQIQNRVSQANGSLPISVINNGLSTRKVMPDSIMYFAIYSPQGTYNELFLKNYASINVIDALKRVKGVGNINEFGSDFGMRIWLRPDLMARLGLTVNDVINAVREQNVQAPAGQIGQHPAPKEEAFQYTVRVKGRLANPEEFANIIVRSQHDGSFVRIKDIGRVELASKYYLHEATYNGAPAAVFSVNLTPEASAIETADLLQKQLAELSANFPDDIVYKIVSDNTKFIRESLREVILTLGQALLLVLLVVYLFLQSWRATLVPMLAVPVSLIGTLASFVILGFSINTLTLFGMVLAIGIVVDDAIVVVEAVELYMNKHGMSALDATKKAMDEVSGPVVAIALILAAVFVPVAFLGGITGQLYKQFAVTVAVSVGLSAFVALSLTPALCSLLLLPHRKVHKKGPLTAFFGYFNKAFDWLTVRYTAAVKLLIRRSFLVVCTLLLCVVGIFWLVRILPTGFIPDEDQGFFLGSVQLPEAATLQRTQDAIAEIDAMAKVIPGIESTITVAGYNMLQGATQPNCGIIVGVLDPWSKRQTPNLSLRAIIGQLQGKARAVHEATLMCFNPPPLPGLGMTGGFNLMLQDRSGGSLVGLENVANQFLGAAMKRPEIAMAYSKFQAQTPAYRVDLDREKAKKLGIPLNDIFTTLQTFLGGYQVNDFSMFGRTYKVVMQAEEQFRGNIRDLAFYFLRSNAGLMVPINTLVRASVTNGPVAIQRYNMYRTAEIGGAAAHGYTSGQALEALEEVAQDVLPQGYGYEWAGLSRQEKEAGRQAPIVFALATIFVFLFLAALYESWTIPFAVLFAVPLGVFGAFGSQWLRGLSNDVYTQIGIVLLIGLAAKNAILIVEYAKNRNRSGMDIVGAATEAAQLRLRPIIMTSMAFILGVVPLVTASGASSAARNTLGTAVFGGMTVATGLAIFTVPVLFVLIQKMAGRVNKLTHKGLLVGDGSLK